jgi:hypothetical protein
MRDKQFQTTKYTTPPPSTNKGNDAPAKRSAVAKSKQPESNPSKKANDKSIVDILPAYIDMLLGCTAAAQWFHPTALSHINDVDFIQAERGIWTGKWTIADDLAQQECLDDDMGFELYMIEGLRTLDSERPPVAYTTDDASVNTFRAEFGTTSNHHTSNLLDQQDRASVSSPPVAVEAAAAPGSGGPTA